MAAPWVCLEAKGTVPYLDLRLDPRGLHTFNNNNRRMSQIYQRIVGLALLVADLGCVPFSGELQELGSLMLYVC